MSLRFGRALTPSGTPSTPPAKSRLVPILEGARLAGAAPYDFEPPRSRCIYCLRDADDHGVWPLFECVDVLARFGSGTVTRLRSVCDFTFPA